MSQKAAAPQPTPPPRMTLQSVIKGKQAEPMSVVLYGVEKIGKSTFGADAPSPIFLDAERGTEEIDTARFPTPETWGDVLEAIRTLTTESHGYKTFVADTLDWIEPKLWDFICARDKKLDIEAYGYGKGYIAALDEWRIFLAAIEKLRTVKRMNVILLAHSWVKTFKNPEGEDYDRFEMKLHAKAAGLIKEWPKAVLFANHETIVTEDDRKRVRGVGTGKRTIYTKRSAAFDAGNRYNLPDTLPLAWSEFSAAVEAGQIADPKIVIEEITRKAKAAGEEIEKKAAGFLVTAGVDPVKLAKLNAWVNSQQKEA
mgnify:CR=1 FL=1